ncbi:Gfo/Idh/MocA family oxidoreductase [candidate division KSB1 bacterium]|nr:Gfo/Idh/MocA family oxidoreductase [candidate division KSB1 bacterium]NIR70626.1 Gfo/Idh/MocA family oxidoreductase [candidate division KSB1 bacterium]NIS23431.1 Gfo/Idh/MocA family oxidoreductase [candidate division KSB1 bacterium]NIT74566.1 Gfo/Idh/MocA family oxidoreductase [candidate division KSB1 bacterium]NIU28393.1 Gfo/Idh/MocA family oxidoreductase [candidate division KSB1 bacterium]
MAQTQWGMIGCGRVTEVKSGPAFNKIAGSKLVAVMRRNAEKAQDYAKRHGVPKWFDDADRLIQDAEVNAIYIATPPDTHAHYTIKAARASKPVYVEKPMARNQEECKQMLAACEQAGVPLFVAYYRRCLPGFLKVRELVESGTIGDIRFVAIDLYYPPRDDDLKRNSLPWRVLPDIAGGGYFVDLASHQLDYLDYLFGPIVSVQGQAANQAGWYPAEDVVSATFRFESGVFGSGVWCFTVAEHSKTDRIRIVGSEGDIEFSSFNHDVPIRLRTRDGIEEIPFPKPEHVQQPLIQTVVDELQGGGTCPSTGRSAARTNWVMDEILREWQNPKT